MTINSPSISWTEAYHLSLKVLLWLKVSRGISFLQLNFISTIESRDSVSYVLEWESASHDLLWGILSGLSYLSQFSQDQKCSISSISLYRSSFLPPLSSLLPCSEHVPFSSESLFQLWGWNCDKFTYPFPTAVDPLLNIMFDQWEIICLLKQSKSAVVIFAVNLQPRIIQVLSPQILLPSQISCILYLCIFCSPDDNFYSCISSWFSSPTKIYLC